MERKSADFASLLEESFQNTKSLEPGSPITGKVVSVKNDYLFFRLPQGGMIGNIPVEEFSESSLPPVGSVLTAYFLREHHGDYEFTTCLQDDRIDRDNLQLAYDSEIPILGTVGTEVNGGYEVKLGSFTALCPYSQLESEKKGKELQGKKFRFVISDWREKQNKIIVSHKKIQDRERSLKKEILKDELKVGAFVTVRIKSIQNFGLIVDLDGLDALVPASEASFRKNTDLTKEFKIGQSLKGKILTLDWKENRISLTIKDFLSDPWSASIPFREGDILEATVDSIKPFGVFMRINEDFSGLVPNRETGVPSRTPLGTVFHPGEKRDVFVLEVNPAKRQISLSIAKAKQANDRREYQQYLSNETGSGSTSSFGDLLKKSLGR